jgi:hypothetical protein
MITVSPIPKIAKAITTSMRVNPVVVKKFLRDVLKTFLDSDIPPRLSPVYYLNSGVNPVVVNQLILDVWKLCFNFIVALPLNYLNNGVNPASNLAFVPLFYP